MFLFTKNVSQQYKHLTHYNYKSFTFNTSHKLHLICSLYYGYAISMCKECYQIQEAASRTVS